MIAYLNDLANRADSGLPLDTGMVVQVCYSDESVLNAFAIIGGNLLFYRGLLKEEPHEYTRTPAASMEQC